MKSKHCGGTKDGPRHGTHHELIMSNQFDLGSLANVSTAGCMWEGTGLHQDSLMST